MLVTFCLWSPFLFLIHICICNTMNIESSIEDIDKVCNIQTKCLLKCSCEQCHQSCLNSVNSSYLISYCRLGHCCVMIYQDPSCCSFYFLFIIYFPVSVIVKASSGPRYVVGCRNKVDKDKLTAGTRVVLDMTTLTIMRALPREVRRCV